MWVSVLIKVPSTFVGLALHVQNVFSNHPPWALAIPAWQEQTRCGRVGLCGALQSRFRVIGMIFGAGRSKLGLVPAVEPDQRCWGQ